MSKGALVVLCSTVGAMLLALLLLGASATGHPGLRFPGLVLLGLTCMVAGTVRWLRERGDTDAEALEHLATAHAELQQDDPAAAGRAASKALATGATPRTRNRALTTLAWAALGQGYAERAKAALDQVSPAHAVDVGCLAAVEAARGRPQPAIQALEVALASGGLDREGAKLFVECHLRAFGIEAAVASAIRTRRVLGRENCELVVSAARAAGAPHAAARLAAALHDEAGTAGPARPSKPSKLGTASV